MQLGDLSDATREELIGLCECLHHTSEILSGEWAKESHALHVLVEDGIVTRDQVEAAQAKGKKNFDAGMGLFGYKKMYDGPARPLTDEEARCVVLM